MELLVAVAILGIISLPIASSFAFSAKIEAKASAAYAANNAADDVLLLLTESGPISGSDENAFETFLESIKYCGVFAQTQPDVLQFTAKYNGKYPFTVTFYDCESFYRVDISLEYSVSGDTMQITRKGVLGIK